MKKLLAQFILFALSLHSFGASNHITTSLFDSISQLHKFTDTYDEFPPMDNENWYDPDYTHFHKKNLPGIITRIAQSIGLKKPLWDAYLFKQLVKQVAESRELNGYIGRFIQKIAPVDDAKLIVFGTCNGALHSIVRCLDELIAQHLLDESLTLVKPNVYLVFNGNVVNGSPYILETITLILVLMQKNPQQIFYTRGQLEDKEYWKEEGLSRELDVKAYHVSNELIPLSKIVRRFFNTLPLALYVIGDSPNSTKNLIRISALGHDTKELEEDNFSQFFDDKQMGVSTFKLGGKKPEKSAIALKVLVKNEPLGIGFTSTAGLRSASKEKGVFVWTVLSGPIWVKRRLFNFFFDAFVIISVKNLTNSWTIRLCNRDIRDVLDFTCGPQLNIFTGMEEKTDIEEKAPVKPSTACACLQEADLRQKVQDIQAEITRVKKERVCPPVPEQPKPTTPPAAAAPEEAKAEAKEKPTQKAPEALPSKEPSAAKPEKAKEPSKPATPPEATPPVETKAEAKEKPAQKAPEASPFKEPSGPKPQGAKDSSKPAAPSETATPIETKKPSKPVISPEPPALAQAKAEDKDKPIEKAKETGPGPVALPGLPKEIKVGQTLDLTRNIKQLGTPVRDGINMAFNELKSKGGINGSTIDLISLDDGYDPKRARKNVETFIKNNIDIILAPVGSVTFESFQDLIEQKKVLALFAMAAASKPLPYTVRLRVTYFREAKTLADYVFTKYSPKKYVLFYQDDAFGLECLRGVKELLKRVGEDRYVEVPYDRSTSDFETQAAIIKNSGADAIGLLATATSAMNLIRQLGTTFFYEKIIFGLHPLQETQFVKFVEREQLKCVISNNSVPNFRATNIEIVKEFNIQAEKQNVQLSAGALYGYIAGSFFIDCLKRLKVPLSKESLLEVLENIKDYDFKGLLMNFDPVNRELLSSVWINDNKIWVEIKDINKSFAIAK